LCLSCISKHSSYPRNTICKSLKNRNATFAFRQSQ
jgi:hypothetical protein